MDMKQYEFPENIEELEYQVFPFDLENDPAIFFHGTSELAFNSIKKEGFRLTQQLPSISFIKTSPLSLRYACERRSPASPNGVVIVVQFPTNATQGVRRENEFLYLHDMSKQPLVVGYCIIPSSYQYR